MPKWSKLGQKLFTWATFGHFLNKIFIKSCLNAPKIPVMYAIYHLVPVIFLIY